MTQFINPNQKSDLNQDVMRDMLSQAFTGIISGFDVTAGSTGFKVNIASGIAWLNSVRVYDDETRIDLELSMTAGVDKHYIIYAQHTPAETFPPPAMTITAVTNGDATVPTLPADSVKIADVFVPAAAADINGCTIEKYGIDHKAGLDLMSFTRPMICIWNIMRYALRIWNGKMKKRDIEKIAHYAELAWTLSGGKIIEKV